MKSITLVSRFLVGWTAVSMAQAVFAQQVGMIDDFEDGTTQFWTEGPPSPNDPTNEATDGPQGADDNYLQNVSSGMAGAGGKMVIINKAQWRNDFLGNGIERIQSDER